MRVAPTSCSVRARWEAPRVAVCETLWYRPDSYFLPEWRGNWAGEGGGPTLGHGIHQIDLLLHLMGPWETVDARAARIARPVEFEDVSMALVTFGSGAVGTVVTSLLSPRELSRIRVDTAGGTLEVNHVYGYRDADWSWTPVPDAATAASLGRDPGLPSADGAGHPEPAESDGDVWTASAGLDQPSNHTAQIDQLVDDMLAGRDHDTTLASTRPTMEFVTALYASSLERETISRRDLTPSNRFYSSLNGGLPADTITARLNGLPAPASDSSPGLDHPLHPHRKAHTMTSLQSRLRAALLMLVCLLIPAACAPGTVGGQSDSDSEGTVTLRMSTWGNDSRLRLTEEAVGRVRAGQPRHHRHMENSELGAYWDKLATRLRPTTRPTSSRWTSPTSRRTAAAMRCST